MGQSYYSCKSCEEVFGDYSDYEYCNCRAKWCCDDCGTDDGLEINEETDERSCNYCRKEDYSNDDLLIKALELLNISREELVSKMK